MGIHDRDYARADRGRGASGSGPRRAGAGGPPGALGRLFDRFGWSMTVWLIAMNVAVFALGIALAATTKTPTWVEGPVTFAQGVPASVQKAPVLIGPVNPQNGIAPILEPGTGRLIGQRQFYPMTFDQAWGHFSTSKGFLSLEVWRLVTFQFLHSGWMHIALNMLGLWVFGPDVEEFLGRKRYLALYLTCGVFGALTFLLLNFLGNTLGQQYRIPGLLFDDVTTPLVGASAGIFGIILAAAYVAPQKMIYILGVLPLRQKPAAYLLIAIAAIQLVMGSNNAGGEAAHVGGAIAGYFFIRRMYLLRDFFDVLGPDEPGRPTSPGKPGKTVAKAVSPEAAEVDRILAKISATGQDSLTDAEREALARASAGNAGAKGPA